MNQKKLESEYKQFFIFQKIMTGVLAVSIVGVLGWIFITSPDQTLILLASLAGLGALAFFVGYNIISYIIKTFVATLEKNKLPTKKG